MYTHTSTYYAIQIIFCIEKGGSSRANLLAKGGGKDKLLDAAATRIGVELDLVTELAQRHKRKREEEEKADEATKKMKQAKTEKELSFLRNNIGRMDGDTEADEERRKREQEENLESDNEEFVGVEDSDDEWEEMNEDERRATFQAYYKREMAKFGTMGTRTALENGNEDEAGIAWEDG